MVKTNKTIKKETKEKKEPGPDKKLKKYFEGIGRRKTSTARVRLLQDEKTIIINEKPLEKYFPTIETQQTVLSVFQKMDMVGKFGVSVRVKGGGINSQSEAIRHGIANALIDFDPESRKTLKNTGFLTRDSRMRERKKFGLKRARRAPQWAKR
ncbi:MAG: 30S ribosomal protein S9 [Candidatus Nealsonbacteria bacterium]|nr:30S ribosomal protein S9 [Candidatus Nealsonbacteria bacterium]